MSPAVRAGAALAALLAVTVTAAYGATCPGAAQCEAGCTVEREAYLMGTRCRLVAVAKERPAGVAFLESALQTLEAAERELTTWRPDSPFARLGTPRPDPGPTPVEAGLCRLLGSLEEWVAATDGAFDPTVGSLVEAWGLERGGRVPGEAELASARARVGFRALGFDRARCTVAPQRTVKLDSGAFGKGEALDRIASPSAIDAWLVDLGGQIAVGGSRSPKWPVAVAHPADRTRAALELTIARGSLATSGGSERTLEADGRRIGHILDPRTGRPSPFDGSVTVWHERALVADILSTALYVMGPDDGLAWAEGRGLAACYLLLRGGGLDVRTTGPFRALSPQPLALGP